MAALVDIADNISLTNLTFETSLDVGGEVHLFLKEIELSLAYSFSSCFLALPDVLYRTIDEHIPRHQHRKADHQFAESDIIDFFIPKRCDCIYCLLL